MGSSGHKISIDSGWDTQENNLMRRWKILEIIDRWTSFFQFLSFSMRSKKIVGNKLGRQTVYSQLVIA